MRFLTVQQTPVWLVTEAPDWSAPVEGRFSVVTHTETSLTQRQARRAFSQTLRCRLRYTALIEGESARLLYRALRRLTAEPVLMPFWPALGTWSNRHESPLTSGLQAVRPDPLGEWTVFATGDLPGIPPADAPWVPVLWGFLAPDQQLSWRNDALLVWSVDFTEAGPPEFALTPATGTAPLGPVPAGQEAPCPLLPFTPQWDERTDHLRIQIRRPVYSFRRQQTPTFYPQSVAQSGTGRFLLADPAAIGRWLRFGLDQSDGTPFWLPGWTSVLRLTSAASADSPLLEVTDTGGVQPGDDILFISGNVQRAGRIRSVDSAHQVTLQSAPGMALSPATTLVTPLLLVALGSGEFTLEWTHAGLALAQLPVREVPPEYREGISSSGLNGLGRLAPRAYLYRFVSRRSGQASVSGWTSFESDLEWAGMTFVSADLGHGDITDSLDLERTGVELNLRLFPGNPLVPMVSGRPEATVAVQILAATLAAGRVDEVEILFTGELGQTRLRGPIMTARCRPMGDRLETPLPRWLRGPTCAATLFHDGCNLIAADWRWTARIAGDVRPDWPFLLPVAGLSAPGPVELLDADAFAGGWVEWGAGMDLQRRPVLASSAVTSGGLVLTLSRSFYGQPLSRDAVALVPGCDLQAGTCQNKFRNYPNFRGHPFVPAANPTLVKRSDGASGGKK